MIIVPAIFGFLIDNNIYLFKIIISILCGFGGLVSYCFLVFLFHLFKTPIDIYKEDKETIESLEERLKPKLLIRFHENENGYVYDEPGDYGTTIGHQISKRMFRIRVDNTSKSKAIEGVKVMLTNIYKCKPEEKGKLPVQLKLRNGTKNRDSVTIPIDGWEFFEVIQAFFVVEKRKMCVFEVCHIERSKNYENLPYFNAENEDYKIKIEVKSNTTTCKPKEFKIGLRDNVIIMWEA